MLKFRRVGAAKGLLAVLIFVMAAFILLSFSKEKFDARALLFMALTMLLIMVQHMLLCFILPNGDRLTGVLVGFLMGIGLVMQYRLNADTALRQLIFSCFGLAAMVIMLMLMKKPIVLMYLRIPAAIISLGILGALMFVGKESGGAVNWISIGGILFQPSEFVKIAMIIVLAGAMSERTSLRELIVPTLFAVAVCALLVLQRDLGAAMLMAMVYMLMFYAATCKLGTTLLGAAACGLPLNEPGSTAIHYGCFYCVPACFLLHFRHGEHIICNVFNKRLSNRAGAYGNSIRRAARNGAGAWVAKAYTGVQDGLYICRDMRRIWHCFRHRHNGSTL